MNIRLVAAQIIDQVTDGHSLAECLEPALANIADPRDRAFIQAVCYGVCRYYTRLDMILSELLKKPMNAKDSDVHSLILVGLYQLIEMRVPSHAAVSETVDATEELDKPWARGLVNAILREYLRSSEKITALIPQDEEAFYAHPIWLVKAIKKAWPAEWESILAENNAHPPFVLRVNKLQHAREAYLEKLPAIKMVADAVLETESGFTLKDPVPTENLPGFSKGSVSVQDGGAQLAVDLMELAPNLRVLDACAAPGGKLTHILEQEENLAAVIAVEKDAGRMVSIKENLTRLQLTDRHVECICADANDVKSWWDNQLFDRILLDAPCSASGVIRRHPDIKLLRQSSDIKQFAETQLDLLNSLWPLLKPDGIFVYATCSIFPEENADVLRKFLSQHPDAEEKKIDADWGITCNIGRQILPGMHGMDGFYYAKLVKA